MNRKLKRILSTVMAVSILASSGAVATFAAEVPTEKGIAISEENFPDEYFREFLLNGSYYVWDENNVCTEIVYDANKDGYLSDSELKNVKHLLIQMTPIRDLTGIEYFTSLVEIGCQHSAVEKVNLENNKELVYLSATKANIQGGLDLSDHKELFSVMLGHNSNLTSVNTSGCEKLSLLDVSLSSLSDIDISENPELSALFIELTNITTVDTSKNPKLDTFIAYNTPLTSLDFSNNPALRSLDVSGTKLNGLDVSTNAALESLVTYNTPLAFLNIGNNNNLIETKIGNSTVSLKVSEESFDITDAFKGIDPDKVTIVSGAQKNGTIISSYSYDTPIVYTYDCGTDANGPVTLTVTLNLTK